MTSPFRFDLHATDGLARRATFHTAHGPVETPCFMPVGTKATVKALTPRDVRELGAHMILANTFHLHLRPGEEVVERVGDALGEGGLHGFMRYDGPILTDSGGFQVFSLAEIRKIDGDGVTFQSPIDGSLIRLTPERSLEIQRALGPDVCMAFDECPSADMTGQPLRDSMEMTLRWLERCLSVPLKPHQTVFPIVQGGMDPDLRRESTRRTVAIAGAAEGFAVGGLAIGEAKAKTYEMLEASLEDLPAGRPRYMMGVGTPEDLVWAVERGIDLFDCVLPTRSARTGRVFSPDGHLNMRNAKHKLDPAPIMEGCDCPACVGGFSRAYIHHLFKQDEILGAILASQHNVRYLIRLCEGMREAIAAGRFGDFKAAFFAERGLATSPFQV
ncbi:MAG: tRNA guanosine(34) transglycosylase Tgt [Sumerlaeia bacterium]